MYEGTFSKDKIPKGQPEQQPSLKKSIFQTHRLDWAGLIFLIFIHIFSIGGLIYLLIYTFIPWQTWLLAIIMYSLTMFGISAGYHRFFSHKNFDASWILKLFLLLCGTASFQNNVLKWCFNHRQHHAFTDHPTKDPYSITNGFWFSQIYWIALTSYDCINQTNEWRKKFSGSPYPLVKDLEKDPLIMFQYHYYLPLAILMCFLLPMGVAWLWADPWGGLIIAGGLRTTLLFHAVGFINSVCHYFGNQPYTTNNSSKSSFWASIFTFGEGYHNFHHAYPYDYRCTVEAFRWDPLKWTINLLAWLGLAKNLKQANLTRPPIKNK